MEQTPARTIDVSFNQTTGPLDRRFQFCVGSDRAIIHLRPEHLRDLTFVKNECGFRYIRFHGLLNEEMGVYHEAADGSPVYDFSKIDRVYDQLLAIGMKPFVELGFMPEGLASGKKTIFWYKGNVTPPKSYDKWGAFIGALVRHLTDRYGKDEVGKWFFEVWNEPNLDGFWTGGQDGYFHLYDVTSRTIKAVDPRYQVGGPATAGGQWIAAFLAHCQENHSPVDFVASHDYGVRQGFLDETGKSQTVLDDSPTSISGTIKRVAAEIHASAFPNLPLYMTEWSSSYSQVDPVHDSYISAAYILQKLHDTGDAAAAMSYWTFSDQFEEGGPPHSPFHGGFGLLNVQGLPKASFYAYQFLNRLGNTQLKCEDPQAVVTRDDRGVSILFWNYTHLKQDMPNKTFFGRDLPSKPVGMARIVVRDLPAGDYEMSATRVGYRHHDVFTAWLDLGKPHLKDAPAHVSEGDLLKLREMSDEADLQKKIHVNHGTATVELDLNENDVYFVRISR